MTRFEIYSGAMLIGWSGLESGDPPMGVALGRFIPADDYSSVRERVVSSSPDADSDLALSVRVVGGDYLQSRGGVHITDYSAHLGSDAIEVSVLGIVHPPYESLFPDHVAAYE